MRLATSSTPGSTLAARERGLPVVRLRELVLRLRVPPLLELLRPPEVERLLELLARELRPLEPERLLELLALELRPLELALRLDPEPPDPPLLACGILTP